ncbi:tandem-95 repeat protein [Vibrio crassostreae]|nr:tandem-95 repeat protein [Vibrio crassostreae]
MGQDRDVTFTYTATDNDTGVSEPKTITITVTGSNDAPVAKDATETTEENTVLNGNVPAATDVDGTVESYQLVDDVTDSLTFNDDGSYVQGSDFDDLPVGQDRDDLHIHRDRQRQSEPKTITITVTAATTRQWQKTRTEENTVLNGNVPAATDVDGTVESYQLVDDVTEGSLTFNDDGSYTFTPGSDFDDLPVGQDRDVTFTYTATDNDTGVSEPKTITITVTGSNDAPVAKDATETTEENTVLNGNVPAATDVDGTVESYQLVDDVTEGSLTFNDDGSYTFTPGSDFDDLPVGQDRDVTFTYTATDNDTGVSEPKTITITVTGSNDAPVAKDATETTEENTVLNGNVPAATDVDGTVESYQLVDDVTEGSLTFNDDGSYTFTQAATSMTCQWVKIET